MFKIGDSVRIPRTRGGFTVAIVRKVQEARPTLGDMSVRLYVNWTERAPVSHIGSLGEVMECVNRGGDPCVEMTDKVAAKWVDADRCMPV